MINFIDEKGVKHSAVVECKKTKGVNGEKSLSGTIYTNGEILEGIGRGWRLEFENEKYCLTYVYPIDEGNRIVVEFDAVHEFFFDLNKKVVYTELNGSNTAKAYLDLIFNGSSYSYVTEVNIPAFEKEGFGMRNRLDLFKEFISATGVEFSVNGKVVRILEKVGSNLSTIVKKGFNLNELRIEKDPGSFITYKKGFGAWHDDDDHSKGRLEVEYLSPLASIYGKLEGDPIVDERYKVASNFETRLKNDVESSYGISVDIDMEDLTRAGYEYEQPHEGDYIMAINKDLGFEQKIRIMSYETSYDTNGNIIDHKVFCGSDNIIRKSTKEDDEFRKEIQAGLEGAISTSNKAWISANGKNAVFEGPEEPTATAIGDIWYQIDGEEKIMRIWNGYEWKPVFNPGVIEETIKDLDAELEQTTITANDAVNKAQQAIESAGFANSSITAANGQIASLEQNLNGFQQVVQNTYADKTTVTALANQWTQTTELANGHTSAINSLGESINLRVTKAEVDEKILEDKMIKDTRSDNQPPSWYYTNYPKQKAYELKYCATIGIPTGFYASVVTEVPWDDASGGTVEQRATTNDGVYQRRGTTNWSSWAKIADSSNVISQINISPENILIASKKIYIDGETYITNGVIKSAMIGDLEVTGAKIANATIGSAKIINVDASKITVGTLTGHTINGAYINGGTITGTSFFNSGTDGDMSIANGRIRAKDFFVDAEGSLTSLTSYVVVRSNQSHVFLQPAEGYGVSVTKIRTAGGIGNFMPITASTFRGGNTNAVFESLNGYTVVRSSGDTQPVYLQGNEIRATSVSSAGNYVAVRASAFPTGSLETLKTDIKKYTDSALQIIRDATIYDYKLKEDIKRGRVKTRIGLVIGHGYNTPNEIIDGDGVEQYAMNSLGWKAIQELDATQITMNFDIWQLKNEIKELKNEINSLRQAVA